MLYVIDVSQSVEHEHPQALEFLRKDCTNVVDFFRKHLGPKAVFTVRELFEFVVKERGVLESEIGKNDAVDIDLLLDAYLDEIHDGLKNRPTPTPQTEIDDEVFKQVYIPISFTEIVDVEAQLCKMDNWDKRDSAAYTSIIKIDTLASTADDLSEICCTLSDSQVEGSDSDNESESDESYNFIEKELKGKKFEDKDLKKERKQAVKDDKSEKRKIKMPKSVKKRKLKVAADKKKK